MNQPWNMQPQKQIRVSPLKVSITFDPTTVKWKIEANQPLSVLQITEFLAAIVNHNLSAMVQQQAGIINTNKPEVENTNGEKS